MAANTAAVAPAEIPSTAPAKAGLVLATLIVASAVANLPLAMANVALPIHRRVLRRLADAAQPGRGRLLAGPGLLGALAGRARRPLRPQDDAAPRPDAGDSRRADRRLRAVDRNPDRAHGIFGGLAAGMAFPTCLALIAALWGGPARTRSIALWAATGGAINACRPADLRDPAAVLPLECRSSWWSFRWRWWPSSWPGNHPGARQRVDGAGRQPRRHPLDGARRDASSWASTLRRSPACAPWCWVWWPSRWWP